MEKLENRNNVRLNNQLLLIDALRKEKRTITDLSDYLEISFCATRHIVDELTACGLCKYSSKQAINKRGRIPLFVEINNNAGVVCGIDFSTKIIKVALYSLDGKLINSASKEDSLFITKNHLAKAENMLKDLLDRPEVNNRKLLSICISSPGIIDTKTYEYVSVFRLEDQKLNPVSYFTNVFSVDVEMYNDVRIGCLAELKTGNFPYKFLNGMLFRIGTFGGISFINNGKIYTGAHGFAGETPNYILDDPIALKNDMNGRVYSLWEVINNINLKKGLPKLKYDEVINIEKVIIDNYKNNDPFTLEALDEACKYNAITIISLCSLLDLDYVVIEGAISDEIFKKICRYVTDLSVNRVRTRIIQSTLGAESSLIGACYQAQTIYFHKSLEKLNQKRLRMDEFKINPSFKDI
ncbi:MAG: ROK family protein [Bacilli bacterium]|nr:ROK family protein [Bacilli bacterium]